MQKHRKQMKDLASEINKLHKQLRKYATHAPLSLQAELGKALMEAQAALPRRKYEPWLREHTTVGPRVGRRYKARYRRWLFTGPARAARSEEEAERDLLRELALYRHHKITLTKHQQIRARVRADSLIEEHRASRRRD